MPASKYGSTAVVEASVTRPADTNAYADGDAISSSTSAPAVLEFEGAARGAGGSGIVLSALLLLSANNTAGDFELRLYDASITPGNDNAAYAPSDSDNAKLVAVVTFDEEIVTNASSGADGNQAFGPVSVNAGFVSADGSLYGQLVARAAYTPVSAEAFSVRLAVLQD